MSLVICLAPKTYAMEVFFADFWRHLRANYQTGARVKVLTRIVLAKTSIILIQSKVLFDLVSCQNNGGKTVGFPLKF